MAKWIYKKYNKGYSAWSEEISTRAPRYRPQNGEECGERYQLIGRPYPPIWDGNKYVMPSGTDRCEPAPVYKMGADLELTQSYMRYDTISSDEHGYFGSGDEISRTRSVIRGTYVGEVTAEDGTYPNDGLHTDGYWYVKDRLAFPELELRIAGTWRTADMGWVNINGVWRDITDMWVNINGTWRKSE